MIVRLKLNLRKFRKEFYGIHINCDKIDKKSKRTNRTECRNKRMLKEV